MLLLYDVILIITLTAFDLSVEPTGISVDFKQK